MEKIKNKNQKINKKSEQVEMRLIIPITFKNFESIPTKIDIMLHN